MTQRIKYAEAAARLNYAAVNEKLDRLAQAGPPKKQNTALAMLEPLREKLLALQHHGWSSQQLTGELKAAGVPVSVARVRECLNHWNNVGKKSAKRRSLNPAKRAPAPSSPTPTTNPPSRSKTPAGDHLSGLKLS